MTFPQLSFHVGAGTLERCQEIRKVGFICAKYCAPRWLSMGSRYSKTCGLLATSRDAISVPRGNRHTVGDESKDVSKTVHTILEGERKTQADMEESRLDGTQLVDQFVMGPFRCRELEGCGSVIWTVDPVTNSFNSTVARPSSRAPLGHPILPSPSASESETADMPRG